MIYYKPYKELLCWAGVFDLRLCFPNIWKTQRKTGAPWAARWGWDPSGNR